MKPNDDPTESSTLTQGDDPIQVLSSSERGTTFPSGRAAVSTVNGCGGGGRGGVLLAPLPGGDGSEHHHDDYMLHDDDPLEVRSEYSRHSSDYSSTEGIEIYRRQSVGGDSSKSLSSRNPRKSLSTSSSTARGLSSRIQRSTGFVKNVYYKRVVLMCTAVCSVLLGLQTTVYVERASVTRQEGLERTIHGFLAFFTMQVGLEVLHYHSKIAKLVTRQTFFFHPPSTKKGLRHDATNQHAACWAVFDSAVVALAWIFTPTLLVLRCFNVLKGLRRAKGLTEVRVLIQAMTAALPRVFALFALLLVVLYMFAVLFCHFYGERIAYFQRLDYAAWTLFQILTLDGWVDIANQTMQVYPHAWILLGVYVVVASGIGLSLLVGVMSQAVTQAAAERVLTSLQDVPMPPPSEAPLFAPPTAGRGRSPRARTRTLSSLPTLLPPLEGLEDGGTAATLPISYASAGSTEDVLRLERKLDALSAQVAQLVRLQASLQQELSRRKLE